MMTAVDPYGGTQYGPPLTAQPGVGQPYGTQPYGTQYGGAPPAIAAAPTLMTPAGTQVVAVPGQPNMMIAYRGQMQEMLPITAENLCKVAGNPIPVECPHCRSNALTEVRTETGARNWCFCVMFSMACACCCLPLMWEQLKDRYHHCGSCKQLIGAKDVNLTPAPYVRQRRRR